MADNNEKRLEKLKENACSVVDNHKQELHEVSKYIWENPELNFEETKAHKFLTEFLERHGFEVTREYTLKTAFRAASKPSKNGLKVGIMCEYDALPQIGHACGHNLIAESAVAAGLALKEVLESNPDLGQVIVLGTPAEEGGGGKVKMIKSGCFEEFDFCMMVHPSSMNCVNVPYLAIQQCSAVYHGKAAHAAAYPWEGVNALDAAVMCYTSISTLRQQMKPTWRVHGVITDGGVKPNIIPERSEVLFYMRAPNERDLKTLTAKVESCLQAAATATGCTVDIQYLTHYRNVITNLVIGNKYQANAEKLGVTMREAKSAGSTDMGDVSYVKPSIHPRFAIGTQASGHSREFAKAASTDTAQVATLKAAKALAMTALDVISDPDLMLEINKEFKESVEEQS